MKKLYVLILSLTITSLSFGQVINEVDADTPGNDAAESMGQLNTLPTLRLMGQKSFCIMEVTKQATLPLIWRE